MLILLIHTAQSSWLNQISKSFDGSKPWERAAAGQTNLLNVKQHQSPPPDIPPFYISDRSTQISQILVLCHFLLYHAISSHQFNAATTPRAVGSNIDFILQFQLVFRNCFFWRIVLKEEQYAGQKEVLWKQMFISVLYQSAQSYATLLATQFTGSFDKTSVTFVPIWFQLCRVILLLCNHWFGSCDALQVHIHDE